MHTPPKLAVLGDGPDADFVRRSAAAAGLSTATDPLSATAVAITTHEHRARLAVALMERSGTAILPPPLALHLGDADALVDAERSRPGHVLYAEPMLHSPLVLHLLEHLRLLGTLRHVEARALAPSSTVAMSGDELAALATHPLAVVLAVANAGGHGRPAGVSAHDSGDAHVSLRLDYASGLVADVAAGHGESTEAHWDLQVAGALGVSRAALLPSPELERDGVPVDVPECRSPGTVDDHMGATAMWHGLVDDLGSGRGPGVGAAFGREVLQVMFAAGESLVDARRIALPWSGPRDASLSQYWNRP